MTDPKRSLRVPASPRARASGSASARFYPRLCLLSFSEFRALRSSWLLGLFALADSAGRPGYRSLRLTLRVSRSLPVSQAFPSSSSNPAHSVCPQVPGPQANFPVLLAGPGLQDPSRGGSPRRSPPASFPSQRPSRLGPAVPARSHLVSPARAAAAAAIYARLVRGWSFKRRFPGAPRGSARSPMAPVAANHAPLPPPPRPAGAAEPLSAQAARVPQSESRWVCWPDQRPSPTLNLGISVARPGVSAFPGSAEASGPFQRQGEASKPCPPARPHSRRGA